MVKSFNYVKRINICKTLNNRYWSQVSRATTDGTEAKNSQSVPQVDQKRKNKISYCKAFCVAFKRNKRGIFTYELG